MSTTDTTQETVAFAAFVGIDWADQQHAICLCPAGRDSMEPSTLEHTPEALAAWVAHLRERFGGRPVAVAVEQRRGALLHALMGHDWLVLYPIHSTTLANYRAAFLPSGAKDDRGDAFWAADLLRRHHAQLRPWRPDGVATRTLARLAEDRRQAVDLRTRLVQELTAALKEYSPQALTWAGAKFLRQSFAEFAEQSVGRSAWAAAFYERQRAEGKNHQAALRSLAFKWIRIPFRCWKDRRPYNEAVYVAALQRRGSPLAARICSAAPASASA